MSDGLLDQLDPDDRRIVLAKMPRRAFRKGDTLFHEGDPGDTLHVVEKGHVAIRTSTPLGDIVTLTVLGPSDSFGEQALLDTGKVRTASAVALDQVETRTLHRKDFDDLRSTSPAVERFLILALAAQVRRLSTHLVEALHVPADQRVVRRLAEAAELYAAGTDEIVLDLKQDDLASMAGTTRPTANQVLKQLEAEGIVRLARGQTTITDLTALRRRAR